MKRIPLQELKRIKSIASNIGDFLSDISDWNNTDLTSLNQLTMKYLLEKLIVNLRFRRVRYEISNLLFIS